VDGLLGFLYTLESVVYLPKIFPDAPLRFVPMRRAVGYFAIEQIGSDIFSAEMLLHG
jgi:hypothetical protein